MKTILAIALSAAFCYSSYALADATHPSAEEFKDALTIFDTAPSSIAAWCNENADEGQSAEDCVKAVYSGAAIITSNYSFDVGKETGESACSNLKSREIFTF